MDNCGVRASIASRNGAKQLRVACGRYSRRFKIVTKGGGGKSFKFSLIRNKSAACVEVNVDVQGVVEAVRCVAASLCFI